MDKAKVDKVAEQETAVAEFLQENKPLLEDPELGPDAAQKLALQISSLILPVADALTAKLNEATRAADLLAAAIRDPHCSAGKTSKREKEHRRLHAEVERLRALQEQLLDFQVEVEAIRQNIREPKEVQQESEDSKQLETDFPKVPQAHARKLKPHIMLSRTSNKLPWWKRLLGVHQEESLDTPTLHPGTPVHEYSLLSGPRESPLKPSEAETDRRDYEKFLDFYSQVLTHLENMVRVRAQDAEDYTPEQDQRWKAQWDEQVDNMAWADDNMDAIEDRNAEVARSELVERRENLASRRDELDSS
jgi:hypothetical protein